MIQNQNILWKLVLSWQESIKPSLWDAAVVISNAKLLLYYCFIVTFNMERFSIAQGKKKNSSMAMKDLVTLESCCLKVTTL